MNGSVTDKLLIISSLPRLGYRRAHRKDKSERVSVRISPELPVLATWGGGGDAQPGQGLPLLVPTHEICANDCFYIGIYQNDHGAE